MAAAEEVAVQISDVEDVRQTLAACLTFFQAEDIQNAQMAFSNVRPSPLSLEIERLATRFRGYLGDYYLARREAELEEEALGVEDDEQEPQNASEPDAEGFEEELSDSPLGEFHAPRHEGRRLTPEEVAGEDTQDYNYTDDDDGIEPIEVE